MAQTLTKTMTKESYRSFVLSDRTKTSIQKSTGLNPKEISMMDEDDVRVSIERKIGKELKIEYICPHLYVNNLK